MDVRAVLAAFDEQVRQNPVPDPTVSIERDAHIVRVVSVSDGWNGVIWNHLDGSTADAVIAAEVERFAESGDWEWKYYSYDEPTDLPRRLLAAGLTPDEEESFMVAELGALDLGVVVPEGVRLVPVEDAADVDAFIRASTDAFEESHPGLEAQVLASLSAQPRTLRAVVALAGDVPVAAGRVELPPSGEFASLWGGGTVPAWRHRGVFRALVAYRAQLARERGFRYLQVDAAPTSRPILERLGFVELAKTVPYRGRVKEPSAGS